MECPIKAHETADLVAYCSGGLDAARGTTLAQHIEACAGCREFVARQQAVWQALDAWEAPPVSAGFDRKLYDRIQQHQVSWWDMLVRPFRPLLVRQGLPVAAALGVMIAAGLLVDRPVPSPVRQDNEAIAEPVAPAQVSPAQMERALDEMETLKEFNRLLPPESN